MSKLPAWDRWLLQSLPEFHLFRSETERDDAIGQLDDGLHFATGYWVQLVGLTAVFVTIFLLFVSPQLRTQPQVGWPLFVASFVLWIALLALHWRRTIARRLRQQLNELGIPVCRKCGYCVRGTQAGRCPECGWAFDELVTRALRASGDEA